MASLFKVGSPVGVKKALLNSSESSASIIGICSTSESCFAVARASGFCCGPRNLWANHSNPSKKGTRQTLRHSPTSPLDSTREITAINANQDRATAANDQTQLSSGRCIPSSLNNEGTERVTIPAPALANASGSYGRQTNPKCGQGSKRVPHRSPPHERRKRLNTNPKHFNAAT
jgi:hypothetical protein